MTTDGLAKNNRDNILFSSLLMWCVCVSVRACVRAFMCVLL